MCSCCAAFVKRGRRHRFWNGAWLCLALGSALTALALALAAPLLQLVGTPADIFADARTYILIMFAGIPAAMLYNFASGALRGIRATRFTSWPFPAC